MNYKIKISTTEVNILQEYCDYMGYTLKLDKTNAMIIANGIPAYIKRIGKRLYAVRFNKQEDLFLSYSTMKHLQEARRAIKQTENKDVIKFIAGLKWAVSKAWSL